MYLSKKDCHNIRRDFNVQKPGEFNGVDGVSCAMAMKLAHVRYRDLPLKCLYLDIPAEGAADGFAVIITPYMALKFREHGDGTVGIDSTHRMSRYNHYLTTLMVRDERKHGVPVAWCISRKRDTETWRRFFRIVKDILGPIQPVNFISDGDFSFFNAWCDIMGVPERQRLCLWHVYKSWGERMVQLGFSGAELKAAKSRLTALVEEPSMDRYA